MLWRYIAGNNLYHALNVASRLTKCGYIPIINYTTEEATSTKHAAQNMLEYENMFTRLENKQNNIKVALKLSQFMFNERLINIAVSMFASNNIQVFIDAESNNNYDRYSNITKNLIIEYNSDKVNILKTYQMYRLDSYKELYRDIIEFDKIKIYHGIKLVRGAYYYSEKHGSHLYTSQELTHSNYNNAIYMINKNSSQTTYCVLATHNDTSIQKALTILNDSNNYDRFKFASLYGMNNYITKNNKIIDSRVEKMVYIPYGPYKEMLPYLSRRLYENSDMLRYMIG